MFPVGTKFLGSRRWTWTGKGFEGGVDVFRLEQHSDTNLTFVNSHGPRRGKDGWFP